MVNLNYKEDGDVLFGKDLRENIAFALSSNLKYAIDGVTITSQDNILKHDLTSRSDFDESNSTTIFAYDKAYFCKVLDKFEDDSINTNIWTITQEDSGDGGSITESNGSLTLNTGNVDDNNAATETIIGDGSEALDFKNFSGDSQCIMNFDYNLQSGAAGDNGILRIQLSDGSTHVNLYNRDIDGGGSEKFFNLRFYLIVDKSSETVDYYVEGDKNASETGIDISSLGSNWYLRFLTKAAEDGGGDSCSARLDIHSIGFLEDGNSGGSKDLVLNSNSVNETVSIGMFTPIYDIKPVNTEFHFSSDSGSNYVIGNEEELVETVDTGSNIKWKIVGDYPTSVSGSSKSIPNFSEGASFYSS